MSYARPLKPIFYTCAVNWAKINGRAKSDSLSLEVGTINTNYDIYDVFDLNPQNLCSFDTNGGTTHQVMAIDFGVAISCDSIAILNHNLNTADGNIRVAYSAAAITTAGGGTEVASDTAVLNAAIGGGTEVIPAKDGDTVFTFTSASARYWSVEIGDEVTFSATDLTVGAIMLGVKYNLPLSPDMNVSHSFGTGGVSISTGLSGKRHSNPNWIKANSENAITDNYIPFRTETGLLQIPGREGYSVSYSVVEDTDIFPSDLSVPAGDTFMHKVFSRTGWNALPFVLGIDSTSTTQGDYLFCRLASNSFNVTQITADVYSTSFSVEQEF